MRYDRAKLEAQLRIDEGCSDVPYQDERGIWTAGIGHNLDAHGIDHETLPVPIPQTTIELWFQEDIERTEEALGINLHWANMLDAARQGVLMNMAFNMGIAKLLGFHKMIAALELANYSAAADEMLDSDWADQVKSRAQRLATVMRMGVGT